MRLFIAIPLPDEPFRVLQGTLPSMQGSLPKAFHLTLQFLGEVDERRIPELTQALQVLSFEPVTLTLNKIGTFPEHGTPRIIWAGFKGDTALDSVNTLQKKVEQATRRLGFTPDKRFSAHVTLARVKSCKDDVRQNVTPVQISAETCCLFKSELLPDGPLYTCLGHTGASTGSCTKRSRQE